MHAGCFVDVLVVVCFGFALTCVVYSLCFECCSGLSVWFLRVVLVILCALVDCGRVVWIGLIPVGWVVRVDFRGFCDLFWFGLGGLDFVDFPIGGF